MNRLLFLVGVIASLYSCQKITATSTSPKKLSGILWTADWRPDGRQIAIGSNEGQVTFMTVEDREINTTYTLEGTVTTLNYHPEDPLIGMALQISKAPCIIYKYKNGTTIKLDSIAEAGARGMEWSPDGEHMAVGDNEGYLLIYTKSGELLKRIQADPKGITGLSWHPAGERIVTVGSRLTIYDRKTDSLAPIRPRKDNILMLSVAWHPSGEFFVTGDYGDYEKKLPVLLQFWNSEGRKIREIEGSKAEYRNMRWSPDGSLLATASDGIRIWDQDGNLLGHHKTDHALWGIDWSPDGTRLVATSGEGEVFIADKGLQRVEKVTFD